MIRSPVPCVITWGCRRPTPTIAGFVDGQVYAWRDGEDVMFDETYVHWVKNETEQTRVILFCDVERPLSNRAS